MCLENEQRFVLTKFLFARNFFLTEADVFVLNFLCHHLRFRRDNVSNRGILLAQSSCPPRYYEINDKEVAMGAEETKHDLWLKRINTWIAILGGSVASIAGTYNFFPSFFPPAPGHIAAVVREEGGTPVARAHVEILSPENVLLAASETDRNGRFIRKDLEAGSYIVKVSRAAFEPQTAKVSIASKKTTDLDLVLRSRSRAQAANTRFDSRPAESSPQPKAISQPEGSAIRSALEETGAAWIKNLSNAGR
jgi:Carboxypeptidase regulatory-like domain